MKKLFTLIIVLSSLITFGQFSATDSVVVTSTNSYTSNGRGFGFVPQQDIYVQKLGKIIPNTSGIYTWVIWDVATQTKIYEQQSLTNTTASYNYELTDSIVKLTSGVEYSLIMYCDATTGAEYYYGSSTQINSHLNYVTTYYCNNCGASTIPTETVSNFHYGVPDLIFECYTTPTVINDTACEFYVSPSGNHTWFTSGTYMDTIFRTTECDSLIIVNLTINNNTTGVDTINACNYYTWINGVTYTASNNTATDTLININGCDSVVTLNLTINTVDTSVIKNNNSLISNANGANIRYQWVDCNNSYAELAGDTNQIFTAQSNGSYAVIISDNFCTDTSSCHEITGISVPTHNNSNDITIYPNPTNDNFTINLDNKSTDIYVKITNINGQVIKNDYFNNKKEIKIDFNEKAGIYFLEIITDNKKTNIKLIKK